MMSLFVTVYEQREYEGELVVERRGKETDLRMRVCGCSSMIIDAVHPSQGVYEFERIVAVPQDKVRFYGASMLFFRDIRNLDNLVAIHGGETDEDGGLYLTEGTLRVTDDDLKRMVSEIGNDRDVAMIIRELHLSRLARMGARKVSEAAADRPDSAWDQTRDPFFWVSLNHPSTNDVAQSDEFAGGRSGGAGGGSGFETTDEPVFQSGRIMVEQEDPPASEVLQAERDDEEVLPSSATSDGLATLPDVVSSLGSSTDDVQDAPVEAADPETPEAAADEPAAESMEVDTSSSDSSSDA